MKKLWKIINVLIIICLALSNGVFAWLALRPGGEETEESEITTMILGRAFMAYDTDHITSNDDEPAIGAIIILRKAHIEEPTKLGDYSYFRNYTVDEKGEYYFGVNPGKYFVVALLENFSSIRYIPATRGFELSEGDTFVGPNIYFSS